MVISHSPHFVLTFVILIASTHGRSLHKNLNDEDVDLSRILLSNDSNTVQGVSFALAPTYTGKTNESDAAGIAAINEAFPLLSVLEQNDDPCLPPVLSWIECNSDPRPRVIALNLGNRDLTGELPDFSSMDALQTIDLSDNALFEVIPPFLATFPHLKELNLAYNLFYGLIPDSLACSKDITVNVTGNVNLYVSKACSPSSNKSRTATTPMTYNFDSSNNNNDGTGFQLPPARKTTKKNKKPAIIGGSVSAIFLLWIAGGGFFIYHHKSKAAAVAAAGNAPNPGVVEPNSGAGTPMEERAMNKSAINHDMNSPQP